MHRWSVHGNHKKAPNGALVLQGGCNPMVSDEGVEENVVAPNRHPVASDGVKDLFDIFVSFDVCPKWQRKCVDLSMHRGKTRIFLVWRICPQDWIRKAPILCTLCNPVADRATASKSKIAEYPMICCNL